MNWEKSLDSYLTIRIKQDKLDRLNSLCEHYCINRSDLVRSMIDDWIRLGERTRAESESSMSGEDEE